MTKSSIILSIVLTASFLVLPSTGAFAASFQICKPTTMEKRMCNVRGGKWNKLSCDCVVNGSTAAISISNNPGDEPGNPSGAPEGNPGGTETSSAAGNPGNGKDVGNAGEKGKDNEPDHSGTSGSGNDSDKGGKGKGKNKD